MKRLIWMVVVCLIASMATMGQDMATNPLSATMRGVLDRYSKNLIATAEEMPVEKYGYRPTPEEMTFGETIGHIAEINNAACSKVSEMPAPQTAKATDSDSKEKLIDGLKASMNYCAEAFSKLTDAKLSDITPNMNGRKVTRLGVVLEVTNDLIDHYAGLSVYIRLNGLLPPTAQRKQ